MKIVVAPNAFKGSLSATQAASSIARGVRRFLPECVIDEIPVSDGGDGLHDVAMEVMDTEEVFVTVTGPRFDPIETSFAWDGRQRLAVIELARASGLALLLEQERDPGCSTTAGTGQLIGAALDAGARSIIVGIGGSATNDGGIGIASELGWRFLDATGNDVSPTGASLAKITVVDRRHRDPRLDAACIDVVCDVSNPLCGPEGAAAVFGPQKGGGPEQLEQLDRGLAHLADLVMAETGMDVRDLDGAGAAGGAGFGLKVFAGGRLRRGTDVIFEVLQLDDKLDGADLVITGEGRFDSQTRMGKAPAAVAERARDRGIPCFVLAGSVGVRVEELRELGVTAALSICPGPLSVEQAMLEAERYLDQAAEQVIRAFVAGRQAGT